MAYDEDLADRIRELTGEEPGLSEQRMFGGLAFLVHGNMAVAAGGQGGLLVRVGPDSIESLLEREGVGPMQMGDRVMSGWLRVEPVGLRTKRQLSGWVERGLAHARSLPPKTAKQRRADLRSRDPS